MISKSAWMPYSASEMYALVDDVDSYHQFLPWCRASRVLSRSEDEVYGLIEIAYGAIRKSFTTCNRLQKNKMIEIRLVEGPLQRLEGFWRFEALTSKTSHISLDLDFEFHNQWGQFVLGPVFTHISNTLVHAFCQRAKEIYGERNVR